MELKMPSYTFNKPTAIWTRQAALWGSCSFNTIQSDLLCQTQVEASTTTWIYDHLTHKPVCEGIKVNRRKQWVISEWDLNQAEDWKAVETWRPWRCFHTSHHEVSGKWDDAAAQETWLKTLLETESAACCTHTHTHTLVAWLVCVSVFTFLLSNLCQQNT